MSTQSQSTRATGRQSVNQQNAQFSTGPLTPEGKQRVRHNALKHGLTAKEVFLAEGESERYESLLVRLTRDWIPVEEVELEILCSLRDAMWRLNSIPVTQINLSTLATEEHMEAFEHLQDNPAAQRCCAQAAGYRANSKLFDQLSRHELRLERSIKNLEQKLVTIREQRLEEARTQQPRTQKPAEPAQSHQTPPAPAQATKPKSESPETDPTKQTQPAAADHIGLSQLGDFSSTIPFRATSHGVNFRVSLQPPTAKSR